MNILTVILLAVVFAFGSCSNADDDYLPPNSDIVTALHELYPGVKDIEWSQKGVYYVADCWVDGNELDVWFDANANWVMTEQELFEEQLPEAVNTAYLESNYADWVIDDITKSICSKYSEVLRREHCIILLMADFSRKRILRVRTLRIGRKCEEYSSHLLVIFCQSPFAGFFIK